MQNYHGLAIGRSTGNLQEMKTTLRVEYFYLASTNEEPAHGLVRRVPIVGVSTKKIAQTNVALDNEQHNFQIYIKYINSDGLFLLSGLDWLRCAIVQSLHLALTSRRIWISLLFL